MNRRSWTLLLVLASLWGSSYLFIKVGLEDLAPEMIVWARVALGALVLVPIAMSRGALRGLSARIGTIAVLALVQVVAPFLLITYGELEISSSLAGILVSAAPVLTVILAVFLDGEERASGVAWAGTALCFVGVALLLGLDLSGSSAAVLGGLMVVLAAAFYAVAGFIVKRRFAGAQPIGVASAALVVATVMLTPLALLNVPDTAPGTAAAASVLGLGVLGTGAAFAIFYTLIARVGPARAALVTYLAPPFAVFYGVTLLGERITAGTIAGLVLIAGGSWLASGSRLPHRRGHAVPHEAAPVAAEPGAPRSISPLPRPAERPTRRAA